MRTARPTGPSEWRERHHERGRYQIIHSSPAPIAVAVSVEASNIARKISGVNRVEYDAARRVSCSAVTRCMPTTGAKRCRDRLSADTPPPVGRASPQ
jgi:hypothetical protein